MHMLLSFQLLRHSLVKKGVTGFWLQKDRVHHGGDTMVAVGGGGKHSSRSRMLAGHIFTPTQETQRESRG